MARLELEAFVAGYLTTLCGKTIGACFRAGMPWGRNTRRAYYLFLACLTRHCLQWTVRAERTSCHWRE
jgi:hypothetical protein